jgi:hypothetical protein
MYRIFAFTENLPKRIIPLKGIPILRLTKLFHSTFHRSPLLTEKKAPFKQSISKQGKTI